ncbi:MAG TPA: M50 family metallopeptidase [Candidatus Angelobacter sp.]
MPKIEQRKAVQTVANLVLGMVIGGVVGFLFMRENIFDWAIRISPNNPAAPFLVLPFALVAGFAAVAIHEMAHALAGVAAGFRFNSLRIGRVQCDRQFRISLYKGRGTGAGGWASLFPVKQDKLIWRAVAMVLAGPLSNLLSVAVVLALPYGKGTFSLVFIYVSGLLGLINLVPLRSRAVISDGGRILMLLRNRPRGERWLAMLKLAEEMRTGPPEKMTPEFIAKATAIEDNSPDTVTAHAIAYAAAFWQRRDDEAARLLEVCLRHSSLASPVQRQGLASDAAVFQGRRRRRTDLAEQWLADVHQEADFPWLRPRAEAAILEAKGDLEAARGKLDEVEKLISASPNQALREMSLPNLKRWKAELGQRPSLTQDCLSADY